MQVLNAKWTSQYVQIPNETARDPNISARAKGVLLEIVSNEQDWVITREHLYKRHKEGRDAIWAAFKELIEQGYVIAIDRENPVAPNHKDYIAYRVSVRSPNFYTFYPESPRGLEIRSGKSGAELQSAIEYNSRIISHNSKIDQQESLFHDIPEEGEKFISSSTVATQGPALSGDDLYEGLGGLPTAQKALIEKYGKSTFEEFMKFYPRVTEEATPKPAPKRNSLASFTEDQQKVYQAYPDKREGASIKSLSANMKTIKVRLKTYDADTMVRTIEAYLAERKRGRIFIENFQTFLNNFDDRFGSLSGSLSKPLPNKAPEEMMNWSASAASRSIKDFPVRVTNGKLLIRVFYEDGSPLYIGQISTSFKTEVISKSQFNDGIRPDWLVFALNDITEEQLWKI